MMKATNDFNSIFSTKNTARLLTIKLYPIFATRQTGLPPFFFPRTYVKFLSATWFMDAGGYPLRLPRVRRSGCRHRSGQTHSPPWILFAPSWVYGYACHSVRAYSRASSPEYSPTVARESYDGACHRDPSGVTHFSRRNSFLLECSRRKVLTNGESAGDGGSEG